MHDAMDRLDSTSIVVELCISAYRQTGRTSQLQTSILRRLYLTGSCRAQVFKGDVNPFIALKKDSHLAANPYLVRASVKTYPGNSSITKPGDVHTLDCIWICFIAIVVIQEDLTATTSRKWPSRNPIHISAKVASSSLRPAASG